MTQISCTIPFSVALKGIFLRLKVTLMMLSGSSQTGLKTQQISNRSLLKTSPSVKCLFDNNKLFN